MPAPRGAAGAAATRPATVTALADGAGASGTLTIAPARLTCPPSDKGGGAYGARPPWPDDPQSITVRSGPAARGPPPPDT